MLSAHRKIILLFLLLWLPAGILAGEEADARLVYFSLIGLEDDELLKSRVVKDVYRTFKNLSNTHLIYDPKGERRAAVKQAESYRLFLRFSGGGPWSLSFELTKESDRSVEKKVEKNNIASEQLQKYSDMALQLVVEPLASSPGKKP